MICPSTRLFGAAALLSLSLSAFQASAQTQVPPAPAQTPATPSSPEPSAPAPAGPPTFPKPDPANFTATAPTKDEVSGFLQANWGYDENRMWQVQAILKTPVEGLSKVVIFVGDKTGKEKPQALEFFALPDGKHIISGDEVIPFGEHPFADTRAQLQQRADGPYRGPASKNFEMVEFADFQCPHCKEAQANMDKLATDFPNARIVFQNNPIASIHPEAEKAAEYGICVAKLGGTNAFFQFASAVFDGQAGLSTSDGATLTLNSAVTKAGLDPAKVATCAGTPEVKAQVDASVKLASDVGIVSVPTLVVDGRSIPANAPYDTLKKIVEYQAKLDGITQ
ncbi:MAG TPA: thioredoxin domain-containing protein [Terracidiphilus sp.]|nr:thioredoxin domain-containing protein [Terracidiphilus sp.]